MSARPPRITWRTRPGGPAIRVTGSLPWAPLRARLVKAPATMLDEIDELVIGARNGAMVALLGYALDRLRAEGLVLEVEQSGGDADPPPD